jgi:hypothetical protein
VPSVYFLGYEIEYTRPSSGGASEQRRRCSEIASEIFACLCSVVTFSGRGTYTTPEQWGHMSRTSLASHGE